MSDTYDENYDEEEESIYISDVDNPENSNLYVKSLIDLWSTNDLKIPFFQRKFVWNIKQASLFIDSLLSNLPIPALMFYKDSQEYQYIIDGQQRTKSILYFTGAMKISDVDNDSKKFINFRLTGLPQNSPYYNKTFKELIEDDPMIRRKLYNRGLSITTVKVKDDKDLVKIFEIFRRLNTGGTPLTKQEIRNCICSGNFNEFLIELNKNEKWQSFITSEKDRKRQKDVELILRFFALYELNTVYKREMDEFLTTYFQKYRNIDEKQMNDKKILFDSVVEAIHDNLGKTPFHIKNGLNSSVCDSIMIAFANNLNNIPHDIKERFYALNNNEIFYKYCSKNSSDNDSVKNRIKLADEILFKQITSVNFKTIKLYELPVSAGNGNFLYDENISYKEISVSNKNADFALKVSGDSMEPDISDGDILLIKKQNIVNSGQVGIFLYDNEIRCKKYRKNKKMISLLSNNKKYPPLTVASNRNFSIIGTVIGTYTHNVVFK